MGKHQVLRIDPNLTRSEFTEPEPNMNLGHAGQLEFNPNLNFPNPYVKIQVGFGFGPPGRVHFARSTNTVGLSAYSGLVFAREHK